MVTSRDALMSNLIEKLEEIAVAHNIKFQDLAVKDYYGTETGWKVEFSGAGCLYECEGSFPIRGTELDGNTFGGQCYMDNDEAMNEGDILSVSYSIHEGHGFPEWAQEDESHLIKEEKKHHEEILIGLMDGIGLLIPELIALQESN